MKVYISGKISGLSYLEAFENFARVERYLKKIGVNEVFNPMTQIDTTLPYREQMDICIENLKKCDMILLQNNWNESPGAHEELTNAMRFKLHVRYDRPVDYHLIQEVCSGAYRPGG